MSFPPLLTFPFLPPRAPASVHLPTPLSSPTLQCSVHYHFFQGPYNPSSSSCSVCISQLWLPTGFSGSYSCPCPCPCCSHCRPGLSFSEYMPCFIRRPHHLGV